MPSRRLDGRPRWVRADGQMGLGWVGGWDRDVLSSCVARLTASIGMNNNYSASPHLIPMTNQT